MQLFLDLETGILSAFGETSQLTQILCKRGDTLLIEVLASSDLPEDATGVLVAKTTPSGQPVALDSAWSPPTTSGGGYIFQLDLNTSEIDALFSGGSTTVDVLAEITWTADGVTSTSQTFTLSISADLWHGDETAPTSAIPDLKATQAEAEAGSNNTKWMTPLRTAQAIAALAAGGAASYELKSASFTASAGKAYAADTTSASLEVTLPATPAEGDVIALADARGTWATNPVVVLRNGGKIEGTAIDFTNNAAGTFFSLVYIDSTTGWRVLASGTKPLNLTAPTITGEYDFTSTNGTWTGSPTSYAYQWQISDDGLTGWADIEGATSSTYLAPEAQEGKYVRLGVIATNSNGPSVEAFSEASAAIELPDFPMTGLLAFWKLSDLTDASGNGHTLTNNNTVTVGAGKIGNAAEFASGAYLSDSDFLSTIPSSGTYALWVYAPATGVYGVVSRYDGSVTGGVQIYLEGGNIVGNPRDTSNYTISHAYPASEWFHAALTWSSGTMKLYVNGALVATDTYGGIGSPANTAFCLGASGDGGVGGAPLEGKIDAAGVWNRALTSEEIAQLYNAGAGVEP